MTVTGDMWQVIHDTWHMTRDTWHVTHDTWHLAHSVGWTFSKNFSSLALPVWDWEGFEDILGKGWRTQWINCRTAPATQGLLIILIFAWLKIHEKGGPSIPSDSSHSHFTLLSWYSHPLPWLSYSRFSPPLTSA